MSEKRHSMVKWSRSSTPSVKRQRLAARLTVVPKQTESQASGMIRLYHMGGCMSNTFGLQTATSATGLFFLKLVFPLKPEQPSRFLTIAIKRNPNHTTSNANCDEIYFSRENGKPVIITSSA